MILALVLLANTAQAQLPNEDYRGIALTALNLRHLATTKRVLVIGAHPDDEDNQLLTYLGLHDGADVAYLSLTRGEGGQNSIGDEMGPAFGIVRSEELLAARRLDRAHQFFARAYDFGFSKTAEEAFQHWPRDSLLADVVATVRRYRPDVMVAIFTGTPRDGHGHHQVSGILAREAFTAAADPNRFPDQIRAGLKPHRTLKLFQATGFRQMDPTQRFATGDFEPLLGRSYAQIAVQSRSRHRSQDQGGAQLPGPRSTGIRLLQSLVPVGVDSSLFAGIDTTLGGRPDSLLARALKQLGAVNSSASLDAFSEVMPYLHDSVHRDFADQAFLQANSVFVDAVTNTEIVVPNSSFDVDVTVWNGSARDFVKIRDLTVSLPEGWRQERTDTIKTDSVAPGNVVTRRVRVFVPANAALSQPYYLTEPMHGDLYTWPANSLNMGRPFQIPEIRARANLMIRGNAVSTIVDATRRLVDPRQGELRRAINVAPRFVLHVEPQVSAVALSSLAAGAGKAINANIVVRSNSNGGTVTVRPQLPDNWRAVPGQATVTLTRQGESQTVKFAVDIPRGTTAGHYDVRFVATDSAGVTYDLEQRSIDYPHIVNHLIFEPAVLRVTVLDARFARGLRVGYLVGSDAAVPDVLEQLGLSVDRLDSRTVSTADLSRYDAIVIGSRAYEVRPDMLVHNAHLLDYARNGGNLVVMYQKQEFARGNFAPYELTMVSPPDRITDEKAPVRLLDTAAVVLARPNRITQNDFAGWVQERTLYEPHTWASQYQPSLEMNDPGEAPKQGAILTADLGKGHYTYTAIPFFREIPAGVPGALRLFINLLSQGVKDVAF